MGFQNKGYLTPVVTGEQLGTAFTLPSTLPLDVVDYGGLFSVNVPIPAGQVTPILNGPLVGKVWRVHLVSVFGTNFVFVTDGGVTKFVLPAPGNVGLQPLGGQLFTGAIAVSNTTASGGTFYITYDMVVSPTIS